MAYTDAEIDALISNLQKQLDLKATRAELSVHAQQNTTQIQTNINDLTTAQSDINEVKALSAELANRLRDDRTHSIGWHQDSSAQDTHVIYVAPEAATATEVSLYIDAGNAVINVLNDTVDIMSADLTASAGSWATFTPDQNSTILTDSGLSIAVLGATGVGEMQVQVDLTFD